MCSFRNYTPRYQFHGFFLWVKYIPLSQYSWECLKHKINVLVTDVYKFIWLIENIIHLTGIKAIYRHQTFQDSFSRKSHLTHKHWIISWGKKETKNIRASGFTFFSIQPPRVPLHILYSEGSKYFFFYWCHFFHIVAFDLWSFQLLSSKRQCPGSSMSRSNLILLQLKLQEQQKWCGGLRAGKGRAIILLVIDALFFFSSSLLPSWPGSHFPLSVHSLMSSVYFFIIPAYHIFRVLS